MTRQFQHNYPIQLLILSKTIHPCSGHEQSASKDNISDTHYPIKLPFKRKPHIVPGRDLHSAPPMSLSLTLT